uniref:Uncharacterized protein n=1 Tax=Opuntia streptacantha TaxID=393608 RepID=A0A7C8Z3P2_OPUST
MTTDLAFSESLPSLSSSSSEVSVSLSPSFLLPIQIFIFLASTPSFPFNFSINFLFFPAANNSATDSLTDFSTSSTHLADSSLYFSTYFSAPSSFLPPFPFFAIFFK